MQAGASLLAGAAFLSAAHSIPAVAGHVVLTPTAGGFDFEGDLKSYDGTTYVLETPVGAMRLPASGFICKSGECPDGTKSTASPKPAAAAGPGRPDYFRIYGDTSLGEDLVPSLIRAFGVSRGELTEEVFRAQSPESRFFLYKNRETPAVEVGMQRYDTAYGLRALATGEATIGMAARGMLPEEEAALRPAGDKPERYNGYVIALDASVVAVSPQRDVKPLTADQLAGIFSGSISDWSELGLEPGPINVYAPPSGNGALDIFTSTILTPRGLVLSPLAARMDDFTRISDKTAADKNGIAVISMAFRRSTNLVPLAGTCGIVTGPSAFTVKTEEYAMAHRSYLYTAGAISKIAADFLVYTQGSEAQTTVADKQFVNQAVVLGARSDASTRTTDAGGPRAGIEAALARRLDADSTNTRRLSITFRFQNGTSALDVRARQDLRRLIDWLNAPQNAAAAIVIAGFTDQAGSFAANTALSQQRAAQIRDTLLREAPGLRAERIEAHGYGPLAPVACNSEPNGPPLNRRVEIWVKG